jgi:general secretion pathway protein F
MPVYEFTALTGSGRKTKGVIDADSAAAARQKIRGQGHYPVEIRETSARTAARTRPPLLSLQLGGRVRPQEVHVATRQLATLLGAGIPLVPALAGLIEQTESRAFRTILAQIKDAVNEGNSLTSALAEHPKLFSRIYVNMVRAGEASGSLDVVLDRLAEFQHALRARIRAAMLYPLFMALVGVVVLFLLITFIVPSITSVFEGTQQALPLPTVLLITMSAFLRQFWWAVVLALLAALAGLRWYLRTPSGRRRWDRLKLTLPGLRDLNVKTASARFGRTLSSLLQSGVPLVTSLQIVRNIVDNVLLADQINEACQELEKGRSLSQFFRGGRWFPPMLVQMMAVGEQSGALDRMLAKAADSYEREVESKILALTSMIEPVMILVMGVAVSFIVVSILLPIFERNQLFR